MGRFAAFPDLTCYLCMQTHDSEINKHIFPHLGNTQDVKLSFIVKTCMVAFGSKQDFIDKCLFKPRFSSPLPGDKIRQQRQFWKQNHAGDTAQMILSLEK